MTSAAERRQVQQVIDARTRALTAALTQWLQRIATQELKHALAELPAMAREISKQAPRWSVDVYEFAKASREDERASTELRRLIEAYGAVQYREGAKRGLAMVRGTPVGGAASIGGRTLRGEDKFSIDEVIPEGLILDYVRSKQPQIARLAPKTRAMARESVRRIIEDALRERPAPAYSEIARRIRTQFHGPGTRLPPGSQRGIGDTTVATGETTAYSGRNGVMYAFSSERAAAIARTEMVQAVNTGIYQGFELAEVAMLQWLAVTSDRASGEREHWKMNGVTTKMGAPFKLPDGTRMLYPGDPSAPIRHTINCRCTVRPVTFRKPKG